MCTHPLVVDPGPGEQGLRFYAGCPLVASNGFRLGSLCVLHSPPSALCCGHHACAADVCLMAEVLSCARDGAMDDKSLSAGQNRLHSFTASGHETFSLALGPAKAVAQRHRHCSAFQPPPLRLPGAFGSLPRTCTPCSAVCTCSMPLCQ